MDRTFFSTCRGQSPRRRNGLSGPAGSQGGTDVHLSGRGLGSAFQGVRSDVRGSGRVSSCQNTCAFPKTCEWRGFPRTVRNAIWLSTCGTRFERNHFTTAYLKAWTRWKTPWSWPWPLWNMIPKKSTDSPDSTGLFVVL